MYKWAHLCPVGSIRFVNILLQYIKFKFDNKLPSFIISIFWLLLSHFNLLLLISSVVYAHKCLQKLAIVPIHWCHYRIRCVTFNLFLQMSSSFSGTFSPQGLVVPTSGHQQGNVTLATVNPSQGVMGTLHFKNMFFLTILLVAEFLSLW